MLLELTIRQFAIIKELKVNFKEGLNILTGETGAGKSIIIDAIQLITGGRGSVEFIRKDADKAEIEALFDLSDSHQVFEILDSLGINSSDEGLLLLKRELLQTGKSVCRINGQLVTLSMLKDVGQSIIQLHSQHQHQQLLSQEKQLQLLDAFGENKIIDIKKQFSDTYQNYTFLNKEAKALLTNEMELTQRIDLLQYQINEIAQAKLQPNEDDELLQQRNRIRHSEKITTNLKTAHHHLSSEQGVVELLAETVSLLEQLTGYDSNLDRLHEQLSSSFYQIEDAAMELDNQLSSLDFDPKLLNSIEERLSLIYHLKRKYGETVNAIIKHAATTEDELEKITNRDIHLEQIQKKLTAVITEITQKALLLSDLRKEIANSLSQEIEKELLDLQMKNITFKVDIHYEENEDGLKVNGKRFHINSNGLDKIIFLISPNLGEPLKPLQKIASGGELSRIMLAVQTILANKDQIPTIIFDEIDTGISGRAAQAVAEKLAFVARDKQVFVVTHLPQVASMADHHYLIQKTMENDSTYTEIHYLEEEKRIDELARMLGGVEVTDLTKRHAKEMIEKTLPIKQIN